MSERIPAPQHPIEIRIAIGANDRAALDNALKQIQESFDSETLPNGCSGGWDGSWSITSVTRDITADEYRAELEEWRLML